MEINPIFAIVHNLWCLVYNKKNQMLIIILFNIFLTNKNTNIFGLIKKGKYKYQYIHLKKNGEI